MIDEDFNKLMENFERTFAKWLTSREIAEVDKQAYEVSKAKLAAYKIGQIVKVVKPKPQPQQTNSLPIRQEGLSIINPSVNSSTLKLDLKGLSFQNKVSTLSQKFAEYLTQPPRNIDLVHIFYWLDGHDPATMPRKTRNAISGQIGGYVANGMLHRYLVKGSKTDVRLFPANWETLPGSLIYQKWINQYGLTYVPHEKTMNKNME